MLALSRLSFITTYIICTLLNEGLRSYEGILHFPHSHAPTTGNRGACPVQF
uniref:Uncharacterized protein n=1 Tax=Rhizophora mucronata TaxID=61149 RepID=A0A2P2Q023_RHIMU